MALGRLNHLAAHEMRIEELIPRPDLLLKIIKNERLKRSFLTYPFRTWRERISLQIMENRSNKVMELWLRLQSDNWCGDCNNENSRGDSET